MSGIGAWYRQFKTSTSTSILTKYRHRYRYWYRYRCIPKNVYLISVCQYLSTMMRSSSQNDREVMFSMWHKEKEVSNRKKTVASKTKQLGVTSFLQAIHTQTHVLANPSPHEGPMKDCYGQISHH